MYASWNSDDKELVHSVDRSAEIKNECPFNPIHTDMCEYTGKEPPVMLIMLNICIATA